MNILLTVASKHGSTREIAEAIAGELRQAGHIVDLHDAGQAPPVNGFEAAVIGSAIYAGSWRGEARQFIEDNQAALAGMPVWLFSSGPLGAENPQPQEPPTQLEELMAKSQARGHQIFVGKMDKNSLNLAERFIARVVKAPYGDFRNWDQIRLWAREIATALETVPGR